MLAFAVAPARVSAPARLDNHVPITTHLPFETHERLRLLAFQARRKKQELINEALVIYRKRRLGTLLPARALNVLGRL
jgi:hypothetical protein